MAQEPVVRTLLRRVIRLGKGLHAHNALTAASAMAFNFFLSFIPLLALAGFVLGLLVRQRGVDAIVAPFFEAMPKEAAQIVRRQLEGLGGSVAAPIAPVAAIGFLLAASAGTHHLMDVFEIALGAKRRKWWKQRAIAFAWLAAMLVALTVAVWLLTKGDAWLHASERTQLRAQLQAQHAAGSGSTGDAALQHARSATKIAATRAPWERMLAVLVVMAVSLAGLAALYRFAVQHPPHVRRRSWPGATLAVVTWLLVSWVFASYATSLGRYAAYYGSLAAVAIVLVWLWLTSLALLLGAELNAQLEGVRDDPS
jgi:membrane protein